MKPESVIVERVCFAPAQLAPPSLPEVAIIGRSNVGKSSLINRVLGQKGLMRVSNTPGRTRGIFFVNLSGKGFLVDLPGFGYAKISQSIKREWAQLVEAYLHRKAPGGAILLVDIRRDPSEGDIQMAEWFRFYNEPFSVVMTKADKVSRGHWRGRAEALRKGFALEAGQAPIPFSAVTGEGADKVSHLIKSYME